MVSFLLPTVVWFCGFRNKRNTFNIFLFLFFLSTEGLGWIFWSNRILSDKIKCNLIYHHFDSYYVLFYFVSKPPEKLAISGFEDWKTTGIHLCIEHCMAAVLFAAACLAVNVASAAPPLRLAAIPRAAAGTRHLSASIPLGFRGADGVYPENPSFDPSTTIYSFFIFIYILFNYQIKFSTIIFNHDFMFWRLSIALLLFPIPSLQFGNRHLSVKTFKYRFKHDLIFSRLPIVLLFSISYLQFFNLHLMFGAIHFSRTICVGLFPKYHRSSAPVSPPVCNSPSKPMLTIRIGKGSNISAQSIFLRWKMMRWQQLRWGLTHRPARGSAKFGGISSGMIFFKA